MLFDLVQNLEWISEDEAKIMGNIFSQSLMSSDLWLFEEATGPLTDPLAAPPCPYPLVPGAGGRLVWITGYPGTGKSTAAQIMARNHGQKAFYYSNYLVLHIPSGYVFFEGDCFGRLLNPYIPVMAENASLAQVGLRNIED